MKISNILESKKENKIHSISKNKTVSEAAQMLSTLRIGSLLVCEDPNSIDGIVSERDIVSRLGQVGASCLSLNVGEIMTSDVKTINSDADARKAVRIMSDGRFRHLPVVDDGKTLGVISIGDVVSARLAEIEQENNALSDMISGATY